jgi:hypothetical protein
MYFNACMMVYRPVYVPVAPALFAWQAIYTALKTEALKPSNQGSLMMPFSINVLSTPLVSNNISGIKSRHLAF